MPNYNITINLAALHNFCITALKGKKGVPTECGIIPASDNNLIKGEKGVYLTITAWESPNAQFGNTHMLKLSSTKEQRETLTQEQLRDYQCIIGNMRPFELAPRDNKPVESPAPQPQVTGLDDLPF